MHATIYVGRKLEENGGVAEPEPVCLKVFKPYEEIESKNCPENEYKVSQMLRDHENIVQIKSFEQ